MDGAAGGAAAVRALFEDPGDTSSNLLPTESPASNRPEGPLAGLFLAKNRLWIGIVEQVDAKPGWTAPFLHRRDARSKVNVRRCWVDSPTCIVSARVSSHDSHIWLRPYDFVCSVPLLPAADRNDGWTFELAPEGLARWRGMRALLDQEGASRHLGMEASLGVQH